MHNTIKHIILIFLCISISLTGYLLLKKNTLRPSLESDVLIVGIWNNKAPYLLIKNEKLTGHDIDLITEIAKRMTKHVSFTIMSQEDIERSLKQGAVHIVYNGLDKKNKYPIIRVSDKYKELKSFISNTLEELNEDGTLEDLYQKWKL